MSNEWTEIEHGGTRIRYRTTGEDLARERNRYDLEYWHGGRREWRTVRNWGSRDWFVLGIEAGKKMATGEQTELSL